MSWQQGKRDLTSLKVGSAVILGLVILIVGLLWGQDMLRAGRMSKVIVVFESGFGLSPGDPVLIAGVKKGQVSRISLTSDNRVAVETIIENDIQLFTSSIFTIESEGLIGSRFVNVTANPGGTSLAPGDTLFGLNASSLNDIFRNVQKLMVRVDDLTASMQAVITDSTVRARIGETFDDFSRTIGLLNQMMVDNQGLIQNSLADLGSVVTNINTAITENVDDFESALISVGNATDGITGVATTIDSLSGALRDMVIRVSAGEGTLWKLAESDSFYYQLVATITHLDSFILDLMANPKKYVRFSVF
ncbi:MlaD family protein [Gemmatimonadota bacterium]